MTDSNENLLNLVRILSDIKQYLQTHSRTLDSNNNFIEEKLRSVTFEANEFFESLTPQIDIASKNIHEIISLLSDILTIIKANDNDLFEFKINILNLQIFIPIHLLFSLSANDLVYQVENQKHLVSLVNMVYQFEEIPSFEKVITLGEKHILDNHLRILGSSGDLYYLLCSNLSLIKEKNLISWANKCFKQFYLLDKVLETYDPLDFYYSNHLAVEDFYREIVGHYTILGNTNATNLLEFLLGIGDTKLFGKIIVKPYIDSLTIEELENKLEFKAYKIRNLINRVSESKNNNEYFSLHDDPLNIISFKLMIALEKYFTFTISKIKTYEKEYNQLETPASNELKNSLELCENWLDTTISLTEKNENILDTPFGGLFNSVFLEYLLLLALDDSKSFAENKDKKPVLEQKLEKYKDIFLHTTHSLESISDFMYFKNYAQVYVYSSIGDNSSLRDLIDEFYSILQYLSKRPFLKLNSLVLLLVLEITINNKAIGNLSNLTDQILEMVNVNTGLEYLKDDVLTYMKMLELESSDRTIIYPNLQKRSSPKILDINSWLLPNFENSKNFKNKNNLKFISFNQMADRII